MNPGEHCSCCEQQRRFDPYAAVVTGAPEAVKAPVLLAAWEDIRSAFAAAEGQWVALTDLQSTIDRPAGTVANLVRAAKNRGVLEHRYAQCAKKHRHLQVRWPQRAATTK